MSISALSKRIWADVKDKGLRYWVFAGAVIVAGVLASNYLDDNYFALGPRYTAYQLMQHTKLDSPHARRVVFISVGDDEFWRGELDRRIPVKRDYLARLITALDAADPALIALDYTLRSPVADGSIVETPAYVQETRKLIDAVEVIALRRPVVLPLTFDESSYDQKTGCYHLESAIFSAHRFRSPKVKVGYINIFTDARTVPLAWPICRGPELQSFSQAIASVLDPNGNAIRRKRGTVFGSFMPQEAFPTVHAGDVLSNPSGQWRDLVNHQAALIGSFCRRDAYHRGPYLDSFETPIGKVPGVLLHGNYAEALVHERVYPVIPRWARTILEGMISITISVLFIRRITKARKMTYLILAGVSAIVVSYFLQQNLGIFFDPLLPVLFVILHSSGEKAFEWREAAYGRKTTTA